MLQALDPLHPNLYTSKYIKYMMTIAILVNLMKELFFFGKSAYLLGNSH